MPPRPDPPRTRSITTRITPPSLPLPAQASPSASTSSSLSSSASLSPPPTILTSQAITRYQAKVSKKARLDYITFSSGIDGTLPTPTAAASSPSSPTLSSSSSSSSSSFSAPITLRKRTFHEATQKSHDCSRDQIQNQSQSHGQSLSNRTRSKQPRLDTAPQSTSSTGPSASAVTRTRAKATGSHQKQSQGIPSFMRQSKNSTSQKRSKPSTKAVARNAQGMSSSSSQDVSASGPLADVEDQNSHGAAMQNSRTDDQGVTPESQGETTVPPLRDEGNADIAAVQRTNEDDEEQKENDEADEEEEDDEDDDDEDEDEDEEDYDHNRQADQDGLFSSGGSMSGMVSGMSSRLKGILNNLRAYQDPSLQLIALQDLAVLLSVSTEETLQGYFSTEAFVKELVLLMRGTGDGDDNPEIMLLACRCLSNLMEAMPASLGSVVHGAAVPVLCAKLLEIQYIDLAEQSLTTLEKISSEYPHAVVKEGGLTAVLMFLDFFSTNVQRTAVKTAANCCRGIQQDSISMVQDILPNLENIIQYSDQKIVEQACLCFVRLADSFKSNAARLQTIISENILRAILSLLSPNANVIVGPHVYTLLLHFVSTVAEHSPALGFTMLEMDIVDTLFLVLTGTHAPANGAENEGPLMVPNIGSRSKEQVSEIIGIVTELLPSLPKDDALFDTEYRYAAQKKEENTRSEEESQSEDVEMATASAAVEVDKREELLKSHPDRVRRMGMILIPTLIEVYSSTVHFRVRQRAIHALVKLIFFTDDNVLKTVLKEVELASFLAVVLSQQEHQTLVVAALQITDILMAKLPSVYRFYFEREGVTFEISKLACLGAELSLSKVVVNTDVSGEGNPKLAKAGDTNDDVNTEVDAETSEKSSGAEPSSTVADASTVDEPTPDAPSATVAAGQRLVSLMTELRNIRNQPDQERTMDEQLNAIERELEAAWSQYSLSGQGSETTTEASHTNSRSSTIEHVRTLQRFITGGSRSVVTSQKAEKGLGAGKIRDWIFERATMIVDMFQTAGASGDTGVHQGTSVLADLKRMAGELRETPDVASRAIKELAGYFSRLGATGISSFEFLNSGLPQALLNYLAEANDSRLTGREDRIRGFIQDFMTITQAESSKSTAMAPFSLLVKKMQEALTRMETFEVEAAQSSLGESRNNSSSSLATQVRLKLTPEEGTEVPSGYHNLVVSIHAIATFRTLDEYLRPRLKPKLSVPETKLAPTSEKSGLLHQNTATSARDPPRTTRRSSRLQRHAKPESEEGIASEANSDSLPTKGTEDTVDSNLDDSQEDSDGDIEEMEYDVERRASVQSTAGIQTSAIDMDSDVQMTDSTTVKAEAAVSTNGVSNGDSACPLKSETSSPPKKDRSVVDPMTPELASSWHIQFSLYGTPISTDMTVYGAIHEYERRNGRSASQRNMWSSMYPIKYKRVETPPPEQLALAAVSQSHSDVDLTFTARMPKELPQHAEYVPILGLLRLLHGLNDDWRRFYGADDQISKEVQRLSPREFVNSKISAKVNRQLEEPLIVASSCLPDWAIGLVTGFPFLFPFETRYTYLQSTAFGFSRSVMRWQNQQQRSGQTDQRDDSQTFLGRIQRQKVRISRQKALESAVRVMDLYGANQAMLEVEYFEEVGTGLGPTLEFYSLVSKEFCKKSLKLWRDGDSEAATEYVSAPQGLFPRPMAHLKGQSDNEKKILKLFKSLGQFIAKAMLDSRIIDVPLSSLFVSQLLGQSLKPHMQLVSSIDPVLARSLRSLQAFVTEKKRIYGLKLASKERESALRGIELHGSKLEDMGLDFTLAGYPQIELKTGGPNIPVTIYNVEEYINLTVDMTVGRGVEAQVAAFRTGFNNVFAIQDLAGFRPEELVNLFGSGEEDWSYETLVDTVKADHGFGSESRAFKNLLEVMSEFDKEERRQFLQFITGSPKLPIGGFKNLHPSFTVVCKPFEAPLKADDYLPSVMTCANYLKMPNYSSKEVALVKFRMAYEEGQGSFHLS